MLALTYGFGEGVTATFIGMKMPTCHGRGIIESGRHFSVAAGARLYIYSAGERLLTFMRDHLSLELAVFFWYYCVTSVVTMMIQADSSALMRR